MALEKIRSIADPSKSGIPKAMLGMPETSDVETGITAPPVIGTLLFNGQRLRMLAIRSINYGPEFSNVPFKVRTTRVERQVKSILSIY